MIGAGLFGTKWWCGDHTMPSLFSWGPIPYYCRETSAASIPTVRTTMNFFRTTSRDQSRQRTEHNGRNGNEASDYHTKAKTWWEGCLNSSGRVGLPWIVLLGFLRLTTSPRVFSNPLSPTQSWEIIDSWMETTVTSILNPGPNHYQIIKTLVLIMEPAEI